MNKSSKQVIEIEIQVQIEHSEEFMKFLESKAKFVGEFHQIDTYYTPSHRNFTEMRPVEEWLRLRDSSGKFSINYKKWHFDTDGKGLFCDEYETPVESIEQVAKIFEALQMIQVTKVDKIRKIWMYEDYEVAIDSVEDLGDFVEIEYKGDSGEEKAQQIKKEMISFLKSYNVGYITRNYVGYPFQLLFPGEVNFEKL